MNDKPPLYGDPVVDQLIEAFFAGNEAGRAYLHQSAEQKITPMIDHITIRCIDIDLRAIPFLKIGYLYQDEMVEYPDQGWWAKVYRKTGFPTLFVDQAYSDARGEKSIIPRWVNQFGEEVLHHLAVLVRDIEEVVDAMRQMGIEFSGEISGKRGTRLRQIFTAAEVRNGAPFTVLELTERNGYDGFYPEQANQLMESSVKTRST